MITIQILKNGIEEKPSIIVAVRNAIFQTFSLFLLSLLLNLCTIMFNKGLQRL